MKYIDSEKLKDEIKKLVRELITLMNKLYYASNYKEWEAELNGYNKILSLINSLQQEQNSIQDAELTDFESALFTAFSYAWQSYLMGEEVNVVQWVKENSAGLLEAAKCQYKQSEMDLEKEVVSIYKTYEVTEHLDT